jgi:ABC-type multidrug transport system ATPase subunit
MNKKIIIIAGPNGAGKTTFARCLAGMERKPMSTPDIAKAQDPDLRASLAAMQRAAALARETAMQTNTNIVIVEDGRLVRIAAEELRRNPPGRKSA